MPNTTYDPSLGFLIIGGIAVADLADGTFLEISYAEDAYKKHVGSGGDVARTRILDVSGSMKVTVMQTGITNDRLMALRNADRIANAGVTSFMFKDLNGNTLAMAPDLWIKKTPSVKRQGKDLENVEWEFEFGHGEIDIGGQIPIPTD
jgi:Protein of unknown function (DUF3277)